MPSYTNSNLRYFWGQVQKQTEWLSNLQQAKSMEFLLNCTFELPLNLKEPQQLKIVIPAPDLVASKSVPQNQNKNTEFIIFVF